MDLLDECLTALLSTENKCEILLSDTGKIIYESFYTTYPFTRWGQIDWDKIKQKERLAAIDEIIPSITKYGKNSSQEVYIIWGDINLPVLKCMLVDVLHHINDITPMGVYATWIYCLSDGWIIEFWHHGEITLDCSGDK